MSNTLLEAALEYARRGWHVFPCGPNGKRPLTAHGHTEATTDELEIREAWRLVPEANIGIACGASGLVVIDEDKSGAIETLFELLPENERGAVRAAHESTLRARTGKGVHYYFFAPQGVELSPRVGIVPGVDIRAGESYVIAPPSLHSNGTQYRWVNEPAEPLPLPMELVPLLQARNEITGSQPGAIIPKGERNSTLTSLAGTMRNKSMTEAEIVAALLVANRERCMPPLLENDVRIIAHSVAKYEPRDKRSAREAPALVRAYDLARETEENYDFIVEGLIARGGVTLLTAKPKFGKTVFAANLAIAVARGESFLTRKTKKGRVIYLGLEGYGQRRQLRELMQKLHVREDDDLFFYLAQSPRDAEEWLRKTVSEQKPNLIVLDTFGRLLRVKDVNDYAEVVKQTDPLLEIAQESGAAQLWLHHERKSGGNDGDESLGSTGILGSVDIQLSLRREADGTRTIRSTDSRLGEPLEPTLVRFDQATGRISLGGTKREAQRVALAEKVWQILSERGPLSLNEIVEATEARRADVVSTLDALAAAGKITVRGSGVRGNPKHYALADSRFRSQPYSGNAGTESTFERDDTAQASPTLHNTEMRTDPFPNEIEVL
jgi:hypothetical protein